MKTGTKSVLFGVHQFLWHPFTVWLAWRALYKEWPSFWECVAIAVHDIGYIGCNKMDDAEGELHPHVGAKIIDWLYCKSHRHSEQRPKILLEANDLYHLVVFHSRYLSAKYRAEPSKLCWADKYSMKFDPAWFYLLRARLSGELKEYRLNAQNDPIGGQMKTDRQWFSWIQRKCIHVALNHEKAVARKHI